MENVRRLHKQWKGIVLLIAFVSNLFIWFAVAHEMPSKYLKVAFLNIGQGDAIYIESPTHNQMLVDGGPSSILLSELKKEMPFYDRSIDTLMVTNPDADHYSGFLDVLPSFQVNHIIEPGTKSDTDRYKQLEQEETEYHVPKTIARRGMIVHLGGGADLHILFPDQDVSTWATNNGSIVAQLTYGSTSVMLTGDAPNKTEEYVLSLDGAHLKSDILKEGHHGSRTSASEPFIKAVSPSSDIISAGLNNRYGHPHKETTDLLNSLKIPTYITYERGTITALSDGLHFKISTEK